MESYEGIPEFRDIFLAKFSTAGVPLWAKAFVGPGTHDVRSIAVDSLGQSIVLAGPLYPQSSLDFGGGALVSAGTPDAFLARLDGAGTHVWSKRYHTSSVWGVNGMATLGANGGVYFAGWFGGTDLSLGGAALPYSGGYDAFIARLDLSTGNQIWSKAYGGASDDLIDQVAPDKFGNVAIAGHFSGTLDLGGGPISGSGDLFLARLDSGGQHLMSRAVAATGSVSVSLAVDSLNNLIVGGNYNGTLDFDGTILTAAGYDVFLAKLSGTGAGLTQWVNSYGQAGNDIGTSVALTGTDRILLAGYTNGTIDLGGGPFTGGAPSDEFIARFSPNGSHEWSRMFTTHWGTFAPLAGDAAGDSYVAAIVDTSPVDFGTGAKLAQPKDMVLAKFAP